MKKLRAAERRQYIRLKSIFPVEFKLLSLDGTRVLSELKQGFTSDVSKGGILLRVNNPQPELSKILANKEAKLLLEIDMPLMGRPIEAVANVAWMSALKEEKRHSCMVGLSFEKIGVKDRKRLVGYARSLYRAPKLTAVALLLMLAMLGVDRVEEINLRRENALLVGRLTDLLQRRSAVMERLGETRRERGALLVELKSKDENIEEIRREREGLLSRDEELKSTVQDLEVLKIELDSSREAKVALESRLERTLQDRDRLQGELDGIVERQEARLEELKSIEGARLKLEKATLDNIYNWLKVHQNRRTGLVASYEGDRALKGAAFIYDQSLIAQALLLYGDMDRARSILDFFARKARKDKGAFVNAYDVNSGGFAEPIVHCGPNLWLGIAVMQYMNKTGDRGYLGLAEDIAVWAISIQAEDPGGGIKGGPDVTWFSTEHNLDAYAFFTMLAQKTGNDKYRKAAQRTLNWIKNNAYTGSEGRIYRGKGDSTIATDTFAWAIAAIGPAVLVETGMNPDAIMKFAEDHCKVTVDFVRPDGKTVKVTGFDFAKPRHLARGGVVSSEWTAQMIVSLNMMSDFYLEMGNYKKAGFYQDKCNFYTNELEKMVITSPSPAGMGAGCFPYATQDNVNTGHGWRTPRGRDTGSVSGTAYAIFAIRGYNPLSLREAKRQNDSLSPEGGEG